MAHYALAYVGLFIVIIGFTLSIAIIFPEIPFLRKDDDSIWSISNDILQILIGLGAAFSVMSWFSEKRRQRIEDFLSDIRRISEKMQEDSANLDNAWKIRLNTFKDFPKDGDTGIFGENLKLLDTLPESLPYYSYELVYLLNRNADLLKDREIISFLRGRLKFLGNLKLYFFAGIINHTTWQQYYSLPNGWIEAEQRKAEVLDFIFLDGGE